MTIPDAREEAVVPTALVAVTVKKYGVPLVSGETRQLLVELTQTIPPGEDVTVYCVMGSPLSTDAVHVTKLDASPVAATTLVGTDGKAAGVAGLDAADEVVPAALVADTTTVYLVPLVRPVIVQLVAPLVVQNSAPGDAVAL